MQKGQYHIIVEVVLIMIGILLTAYVVGIFTNVRDGATSVAINDNFNELADQVATGIVKVSVSPNAIERMQIPGKIAGVSYKLVLNESHITVMSLDSSVNASKQIFNIGQPNRIIRSEVAGSALMVEAVSEGGSIRIRRGDWTVS